MPCRIASRRVQRNSVIETIQSSYDAVGNRLAISSGNTTPLAIARAVFDNSGVRVDSVYSDRNELLSKSWTGSSIDDLKIGFAYNDRRAYQDRYSFAGRELDTSGLYHNCARAYNAATGTFIQQDPISFESNEANLYRYALSVSDYAVKLKNISLKVAQNCIGKNR